MSKKELRIHVSESLALRLKVFCAANGISVPLQVAELIRKFLEVQEPNMETMRRLRRK